MCYCFSGCCSVEQVVQVASYKAKSTGVSDVAVQPVVDNIPHHQIMFFRARFFHLMLLWSLLLSRLCSLCKCRCCSLALFLSLPWLQRIFISDISVTRYQMPDTRYICFVPGNILHPTIFLHQTILLVVQVSLLLPCIVFLLPWLQLIKRVQRLD